MKAFRLLALTMLFYLGASAQYGNIWYFGRNAGLDFNTFPPKVLTNGALNTYEGCASFSDKNGQISFYTDGITVYNKLHQIMDNGTNLYGNSSATQSGIIVPWPGNDSLFYIFTADAFQTGLVNGYTYSIVNINMNGGLGKVIEKNVRLYPEKCTEKIAIAKHSNNKDWWVITKEFGSNRFKVFKLDKTGINMTPVVTDIGPVHTGGDAVSAGCMRASGDGKKLAVAINSFGGGGSSLSETNLFDFDNSTGILSNLVVIPGADPYGLEFSPNSKILYVSYEPYSTLPLVGKIDQFDLTRPTAADLLASRVRITPDNYPGKPCGMQIAPDGKIYVIRESSLFMDVIHNPDTLGVNCKYQVEYLYLEGKMNGMMPPNIISTFLIPVQVNIGLDTLSLCNRQVHFKPRSNYPTILGYQWDFGDGTFSSDQEPLKNYDWNKDTFEVNLDLTVKVPLAGLPDSVIETRRATLVVAFDAKPVARFEAPTLCGDRGIQFSDSSKIRAGEVKGWYWDYGNGITGTQQSPKYPYPDFGTYTVKFVAKSPRGCPSDTAYKTIIVKDKPKADFTDIGFCTGIEKTFTNKSTVSAPDAIVRYHWNFADGSTAIVANPVKTFTQGTYGVRLVVETDKQCLSDTLVKSVVTEAFPQPDISFKPGCEGLGVQFTDKTALAYGNLQKWEWSYGDGKKGVVQHPEYAFPAYGDYTVSMHVSTVNGCDGTVSRPIHIESIPVAAFENTKPCFGERIEFSNKSTTDFGAIAGYSWHFGDGTSSSDKDAHHTYRTDDFMNVVLVATSVNGCHSIPFEKKFPIFQMHVSAGPDTSVIIDEPFRLYGSGGFTYHWSPSNMLSSDTAASPQGVLNHNQSFQLLATNEQGCEASAAVTVKVYQGPSIYVPNAFTPNGDGKNDILKVLPVGITLDYFNVYNRWGQLVFTTSSIYRGWDGTVKGVLQPSETYVWMAKGTDYKGRPVLRKGSVTILQ
jgi:gliding motility-associated-like protein